MGTFRTFRTLSHPRPDTSPVHSSNQFLTTRTLQPPTVSSPPLRYRHTHHHTLSRLDCYTFAFHYWLFYDDSHHDLIFIHVTEKDLSAGTARTHSASLAKSFRGWYKKVK